MRHETKMKDESDGEELIADVIGTVFDEDLTILGERS